MVPLEVELLANVEELAATADQHCICLKLHCVFAYALWSLSSSTELAERSRSERRRSLIAFTGAILGVLSAALLLLLEPFWSSLVEHADLAIIWVISGMVLAGAATVC
jgi:hypothetical protein